MSDLLTAALNYADLGYEVFPCRAGEKTPATDHGFKDATTDAEQIERWWNATPHANIGLVADGLLIVDIDGSDNPWLTPERAADLQQAPLSLTPNGGRHYLFRADWGKNTAGKLALKVDTRGAGGYIVVPPSKLAGEKLYAWAPGMDLDCSIEKLPEPPAWLAKALDDRKPAASTSEVTESTSIVEGKRNATLTSVAGYLRRGNFSQAEIESSLQKVNLERCKPPLDSSEVSIIAKSVAGYEPDQMTAGELWLAEGTTGVMMRCLLDIEAEEIRWLWTDRIARGCITIIVGRPGGGKSFFTTDLGAVISTGGKFPDGTPCELGDVLFLSAEDDPARVIRPRMDAHGADASRIHLLEGVYRLDEAGRTSEVMVTLADIRAIEEALERLPGCSLIVVDPIGSYIGGRVDAHRDNEVRGVLAPLAKLAERRDVAVLLIAHTKKGGAIHADDMLLGSRAFSGVARTVWHLTRDPEDHNRRLLLPGKNNLAPEGTGLAFRIDGEPAKLWWEPGEVTMTADEALVIENKPGKPGPKQTTRDEARDFLESALKDGPRLAAELLDEADEVHDISNKTLRRAKKELGIIAYQEEVPGPWSWKLFDLGPILDPQAPDGQPDGQSVPYGGNLDHLDHLGNTEPITTAV